MELSLHSCIIAGVVTEQWYTELAEKTSLYNEAARSAIPAIRLRPYIKLEERGRGSESTTNNLTPPVRGNKPGKLDTVM